MARTFQYLLDVPRRLHQDQRGAIAPLSVFAIFMFTILMVQIVNVGRQIDDKLRMQNAADASAYSGATVLARGLNAIAFSNHMLCETFALVAYMREGRDRKSEKLIPDILDAWEAVGNQFAHGTGTAPLSQKFKRMGQAIVAKVPVEREMVRDFCEMTFHQSRITLPLFEYILAGPESTTYEGRSDKSLGGFIPRFQRALLQSVPHMSSMATDEISIRYGERVQSQHKSEKLRGLMWSTNVEVVGHLDESAPATRTLPAIDPSRYGNDLSQIGNTACYECISRTQRRQLALHYLEDWIRFWMSDYFGWSDTVSGGVTGESDIAGSLLSGVRPVRDGAITAKMSNLINLWRVFTCANLNTLLEEEYPFTNLPFVMREPPTFPDSCVRVVDPADPHYPGGPCDPPRPLNQQTLEKNFHFVSSVYWPHQQTMFPGLFRNPLDREERAYATAFAQATIFLPRAKFQCCQWADQVPCTLPNGNPGMCCMIHYDSSPGSWNLYTRSNTDPESVQAYLKSLGGQAEASFETPWERFGQWNLFNQHWTAKLVPATASNVSAIVSQHPGPYLNGGLQNYQSPPLQNVSPQDFHFVNGH
ncbi:MAG: Tad domain-containing protein [Planctomycetales bacterium]|nr:Tad domain-containing protein [Planctomycetales bacterium]